MWEHIEEEILPNALMIGVQYELFWTLDPKSLAPFIKAFVLKQKYDDTCSWQLGMYIQQAIVACFSKSAKYPTKPMTSDKPLTLPKPETNEERQQRMKANFMRHAMLMNKKLGKDGV
jgi:hypothetical protein